MRVLELLGTVHQPLSHAQIETLLEAEAALRMDRVTLYRILDSLTTVGLLLKVVDARGVFRFSSADAARAHESHVHFRCQTCSGVFCLDAQPPLAPELPSGFRLSAVEFGLRGTCPQCVQAAGGV